MTSLQDSARERQELWERNENARVRRSQWCGCATPHRRRMYFGHWFCLVCEKLARNGRLW